jgi:hypothetical protein
MRITTILILTIFFASSAQDKYVGIKAGVTFANFWGDGVDRLNNQIASTGTGFDDKNLIRFRASFFTSKEILPDLFGIQTEISWIETGKAWEITVNGEKKNVQIQTDYLQFPWLVKLSLPIWLRPSLYTGPAFSIMFRSRLKNTNAVLDTIPFIGIQQAGSEIFEYKTNIIDLGLVSGLDVMLPLGPGNVIIDLRYYLGGLDVFNFPQGKSIRNYHFAIEAGYAFNFPGGY